jgi:hypothetical protein
MDQIPAIFAGYPIHFAGSDDTTPPGCTLIITTVLDLLTTYIIRDGEVIGRIEVQRDRQYGYAGNRLKGGYLVGMADSATLGARIVARADIEGA